MNRENYPVRYIVWEDGEGRMRCEIGWEIGRTEGEEGAVTLAAGLVVVSNDGYVPERIVTVPISNIHEERPFDIPDVHLVM